MDRFLADNKHLITGDIYVTFFKKRLKIYAWAVKDRCETLENCVGFIHGTFIAIACPVRNSVHVAYNGRKRKHTLKFQAVTTPDGL